LKREETVKITEVQKLIAATARAAGDDFEKRQDWQDFWRINYKR
jgi:hypothetical protein